MRRLTLRNLVAHKMRLMMSALSIILGVGFLAGVLTFSHGLQTTFDGIVEGSTPAGIMRAKGLDDAASAPQNTNLTVGPKTIADLKALPEVARADGQIEGYGLYLLDKDQSLMGGNGAPTLAFNHTDGPNMQGEQPLVLTQGSWPTSDDEIVLDSTAFSKSGYGLGEDATLIVGASTAEVAKDPQSAIKRFKIVGVGDFNGGGTAGATLLIFSTHGAQKLFLGGADRFTSVALTPADGVSQEQLAEAAGSVAPAGFTAVTGDKVVKETQKTIGQFLGIIKNFLLIFALIAIVVGAFIIANTFSILVAQRVRELALLRALGASRKQVTRSVLLESFLMALIGSTIGIAVGWALARGLAFVFTQAGLDIGSRTLVLTPTTVVISYVVGILITMAASWLPARRAAKVAPVAAMREVLVSDEGSLRRRTLLGGIATLIGVLIAGYGLMGAPGPDSAWVGVAAVIWILSLATISPVVGRPLLRGVRNLYGRVFKAPGRLAGENALRNPRRTGATASALMIGLALVSAIGVLAASMNKSADQLVDEQFVSDYVVQSIGFSPFPTALGDQIAAVDGVGKVSRTQFASAKVEGEKGQTFLAGVTPEFASIYDLPMAAGSFGLADGKVMLSQSQAKKLKLKVGDTLKLRFPGDQELSPRISGIFKDTPVTAGVVLPMDQLGQVGIQRMDSDLSIDVAPGADPSTVRAAIDKVAKPFKMVTVNDKAEFADSIRGQVNQLLYMIYGLLALAIIIAIIGIVNTLGLSVLERTKEIGLLRAVGLPRRGLRRMITLESVAIAVLGAVLGMVLGVVIGVLVRQTLKDDLTELALPLGQLGVFLIIAVIVGVLAAIVPAVRASRMKVLDAIAEE